MPSRQARTTAATILRDHFDTEASDAGLRSLDLAGTGGRGSRSFDASAVARADRTKAKEIGASLGSGYTHARVRTALKKLSPEHVEILSLTYGLRFRTRDTEDSKHRRALPQHERNWRVRLAEIYGQDGPMVLASSVSNGDVGWLLEASKTHSNSIEERARKLLHAALDVFCLAYGIDATPAPRTRSSEKTRSRILASHAENGHIIGG
jgi:hypothetical protein